MKCKEKINRCINWIKVNRSDLIIYAAYFCTAIGLLVLICFLLLINETYDIGGEVTPDEMAQTGQVGDFIGGVIGSIWALAGVFLYFSALKLQQKEMKSQRLEMIENQKLLDQQLFETTFFNLLKVQENIRENIRAYFFWIKIKKDIINEERFEKKGVNFFGLSQFFLKHLYGLISRCDSINGYTLESLQDQLHCFMTTRDFNEDSYFEDELELEDYKIWIIDQYVGMKFNIQSVDFSKIKKEASELKKCAYIYWLLYSQYDFCLGHYCRHFYNLVKYLDDYNNQLLSKTNRDDQENIKQIEHKINGYLSFIQSSLSSPELVILYYNMLLFPKAEVLYVKYNIFENLHIESLIREEHASFFPNIKLKSENDLRKFFGGD